MKHVIFSFLLFSKAHSSDCPWWQVKVSGSDIDKHIREKSIVREHQRAEHCRNKWKDANVYIKKFMDDPIAGWSQKGELFKNWSKNEMQVLLEILPDLPIWAESEKYKFHRIKKSIFKDNPASSELSEGSIIFYDQFFKEKSKKLIVVHEIAHHLYKKNSPKDLAEFLSLSGWSVEVNSKGKVFESPPRKLILPDSSLGKEEDYANHLETYYKSPESYKVSYPKIYDFFKQRYPL
jgi:hypothetical protein